MNVAELDRDYLVHPLSELRRDQDRRLVVAAEGIRIHLEDGRTLIDGLSGLWNILVGHGRHEIGDAATRQMQTLPYCRASSCGRARTPRCLHRRSARPGRTSTRSSRSRRTPSAPRYRRPET